MLREYYCLQRKEIAQRLQNPRLLKISFHTFRHWKGTTLYHDTRDLIEVKYQLGHKSIRSTEVHIHISKSYYTGDSQKWFCIVVRTEEELINAVNSGFELVAETKGPTSRDTSKNTNNPSFSFPTTQNAQQQPIEKRSSGRREKEKCATCEYE